MNWAKNGESAGTQGYAYRAEAIQIVLLGGLYRRSENLLARQRVQVYGV